MGSSIETFFGAWSIVDASERTAAIDAALGDGASYADPRTPEPLTGAGAVSEYVGMFAQMAPGASAVVVNSSESHGKTRATIAFRMAEGSEQLGQYFVEHDDAGNIASMTGFVGLGTPE